MSVFTQASETIIRTLGTDAVIKINSVQSSIKAIYLNDFQKAQLLSVSFDASKPTCAILTSAHTSAVADRDQIKITGENNNGWFTIRSIQPSSKGLTILELSTD